MKNARIEAVRMVREIRDAQHEQLKEKSWEERVAFYRQHAEKLHEEIHQKGEPRRTARRPDSGMKRPRGRS